MSSKYFDSFSMTGVYIVARDARSSRVSRASRSMFARFVLFRVSSGPPNRGGGDVPSRIAVSGPNWPKLSNNNLGAFKGLPNGQICTMSRTSALNIAICAQCPTNVA